MELGMQSHTPSQPQSQQPRPNSQPRRALSSLQIREIYTRIQQLKVQHGTAVSRVPEYLQLMSLLGQDANFRKQLQAMQQRGNGATQLHQQQPQPQPQTQHVPQAPSQQPPMHSQFSQTGFSNAGSPASASSPRPPQSSIFSQQQSQILKCQITAFKGFVQHQPPDPEVAGIISFAYQQLQRQRMMAQRTLGFQQQPRQQQPQQQQPQQQQQQQQFAPQQQQPPQQQIATPQQQQQFTQAQLLAQQQAQQAQQAKRKPKKSAKKKPPKNMRSSKSATPVSSAVTPVSTAAMSPPASAATPQPAQPTSRPASQTPVLAAAVAAAPAPPATAVPLPPHPPQELKKLTEQFRWIDNIVPTQNPHDTVDSFTLPEAMSDIPFDFFSNPKSRVLTPSLMPPSLDIKQTIQIQNLVRELEFERETQKGDGSIDASVYPLQKALRGYVLSCVFHQNMLLTNHLPNFSARTRTINMTDASVTFALSREQKAMAIQSKRERVRERTKTLLSASADFNSIRLHRKQRYQRLGHQLAGTHAQIEKEEQKWLEKNAKKRLQALKANDEEAYVKLLDQTKDTRITHLLRQTNTFLESLTQAVKTQQRDTEDRMLANGHIEDDESAEPEDSEDADYYGVAHRIKENVTTQPKMLIGGTLKEYQLQGLEWMVSLFNNHLNGILADEMGLGKTIQTISLLTYIYEQKGIHGPFLIIVPLSTLPNWNSELDKWAPGLRKITYKGAPSYRKELGHQVRTGNFDVLVTTYEYVIKDKSVLSKVRWVHMIIDEGHRMKNAKSKLSSTLTEHYHSDYRLILTGTPLQNNLPELWALLNFVLPKIFNSVKSFDEWFNTPFANAGGQDKIALSEEETLLVIRRLHKVLRPFLLRRLKKDVEKDLPDKVEKVIKCQKSGLQAKMYYQMLKYNKLFVGDKDNNGPVGIKGMNNKLMQLRKICNHPFVFDAIEDMINPKGETNDLIWRVSGKFELLDKVLAKLHASGHRVLIFFQMTQIMDIMEDFLRYRGMQYLRLDGDTKADDRTELLHMFNADNSPYFLFLLSTRAGGLGLNLQTADTVIIFDTDWNPHQDLQAQDRAHRIGQKHEVRILRLITNDSIEENILERAQAKLDIDGKVIQAGKFDQKSTAEEQEALLRKLLESEENEKEEGGDLDDDELNQILARNEDEIMLFQKMDKERDEKWTEKFGDRHRLFSEAELPEIYNKEPEPVNELKEVLDYGRTRREHKVIHYDENMSEEAWLKSINGYASDDDEQEKPKKRGRKRGRKPKNAAASSVASESVPGSTGLSASSSVSSVDNKNRKRSRSSTADAIGGAQRKRRPRGMPISLPVARDQSVPPPILSQEQLSALRTQMEMIFDHILNYVDEAGRKLSTIFLVKPARKVYPDYYVIIKHPLAFDGIGRRIHSQVYISLEEFMYDVHTMFKNARIYNQEGSVVYEDSQFLENQALQLYKQMSGGKEMDFIEFDIKFGLTREAFLKVTKGIQESASREPTPNMGSMGNMGQPSQYL